MLEAVKELGEYIKNKEGLSDAEVFVDKAKLDRNTKHIIFILFQVDGGNLSYKKCLLEDYEQRKAVLCLYRGGSSSGTDILPSAIVTDIEKTFRNRILKWFKDREGDYIKKINEELENKEDKIKEDLVKKYNEIPKEERNNVLLSIKLEEGGREKYLWNISEFSEILKRDSVKRYYLLKTIGESRGSGTCYLCGDEKEVYGFVPQSFGFSFSTADKKGFTPHHVQKEQWKQAPICEDCAKYLELGKKFLDNYLSFPKRRYNFFSFKYYVIPEFIFRGWLEELYEIITHYRDKDYTDGLLSEEDDLEEIVMEKEDVLKLIFLFYTSKGGGKYIDIERYVEDVLPSWIKKIYDSQNKIKKLDIFQERNMKKLFNKWEGGFVEGRVGKENGLGKNNWYIKFIRDLFPSNKEDGVYDKYFMDTVTSILSGKEVDKNFIIPTIMDRVRSAYKKKKGYDLRLLCLKGFMVYLFLIKMNLLKGEKMKLEEDLEELEEKSLNEKVEQFFSRHGFDNSAKKAAFSVGVLVGYLLYVQRTERLAGFGEEPFWPNLYGLVLDEKKIKNIFTKSLSKLRQYNRGYPTLESVVSKHLAETEGNWTLSNDETSYYFALGMTLEPVFLKKEEKEVS